MGSAVTCWLHVGDLHVTGPEDAALADLARIVGQVGRLPPGSLDFVVLPGDNADDARPAQFEAIQARLSGLATPVHIVPGDHDNVGGSLDAYLERLGHALPCSARYGRTRCLFLDMVSAGTGGPDFRLDGSQLGWLEAEIGAAEQEGETVAVFAHTYPADLCAGGSRFRAALRRPAVRVLDMGHTHYNELANDGSTIFMATRSTGQVEEGPVGFSVSAIDGAAIDGAAIDAAVVSWRFRTLAAGWPMVLITRPADCRLGLPGGEDAGLVRAKILSDEAIEEVACGIDGAWFPMRRSAEAGLWEWRAEQPAIWATAACVEVRARDALGRHDRDRVEVAPPGWVAPARVADGSDRDRVVWPERDIPGTQLGPNRNGRHW